MKTLKLIIFLFLCIILVTNVNSQVRCGDGSYCGRREKCCYVTGKGFYTCCEEDYECCGDGLKCCKYTNIIDSISTSKQSPIVNEDKLNEYSQVINAFLQKIKFYNSFPQTTECGKKIQFLFPDFIEVFLELKQATSAEMVIQISIQAYQDLSFKITTILLECEDVSKEIKQRIHEISKQMESEGYIANLIMNAIMESSDIYDTITFAFDSFNNGDYKLCGEHLGSAFNMIFMLELE